MAATLADAPESKAFLLAAAARLVSADFAVTHARRTLPDEAQRRHVLALAGGALLELRLYADAARFLLASTEGDPQAESRRLQFEALATTRTSESLTLPDEDPATPGLRMLQLALLPEPSKEALGAVFSSGLVDSTPGPELLRDFGIARASIARAGGSAEIAVDMALSHRDVSTEGTETGGYRVSIGSTLAGAGGRTFRVFVVREKKAYRLVASEDTPDRIGAHVLELIDHGDLDSARQWLDWAAEVPAVTHDDVFTRHWSRTGARDRGSIRVAAALLAAEGAGASPAAPVLAEARARTSGDEARGLGLRLARAYLQLKKHQDALNAVRPLAASGADAAEGFALQDAALHGLGRTAERRTAAEARVRAAPTDSQAAAILMSILSDQGDFASAEQVGRRAITSGVDGKQRFFNELAWLALCHGSVSPRTVEDARTAASLANGTDTAIDHTAAAVAAEAGHLAEAREDILRVVEGHGGAPDSDDWYVFGRLYEQYGLDADAIAAYRRVEMSEVSDSLSTAHLARRRLEALGATKG